MKTNTIKKIATGIIVLLTSTSAFGDSLQIPLFSDHYSTDEMNELNPGLIFEIDHNENVSFLAGGYKNSYDKLSLIAGVEVQYKYIGAQIGLATGYKEMTGMAISPIGTVFGQYQVVENFGIRLSAIPHKHGAIGLSFVVDY